METLLITRHFTLYFRYKEKLRVHGLRVMSIVEKTMHRLENNRKCLQMLKYYGKKHERYTLLQLTNRQLIFFSTQILLQCTSSSSILKRGNFVTKCLCCIARHYHSE